MLEGSFFNRPEVFIIAEIGNNHNGSMERARELVDQAVASGADAVKFQMRHLNSLYRKRTLEKEGEDLGTEYIIDLLERFDFTVSQHLEIKQYCDSKNIMYFCTPWDLDSVEILETFEVSLYKVASADLTNTPLLERLVNSHKPIIISTGMSEESEIISAIDFLKLKKADFAVLHCNSSYPAPFSDINLKYLKRLGGLCEHTGYSGHERGLAVSLAAVALGARIIERHFTLDRSMEGPDHAASLEPIDFRRMVDGIREIEQAMGCESKQISQGEMINRENLAKSICAAKKIRKGELIVREALCVKSPGQGLSAQKIDGLIGRFAKRDFEEEDFFYESDLSDADGDLNYKFSFKKQWGIPVRFHDFGAFSELIEPDIWEFHLSYGDLSVDYRKLIPNVNNARLVVHAPELFAGSRLMNLAAFDEKERVYSIEQTKRVIDLTLNLQQHFKGSIPVIVANVGGFSMDHPMSSDEKSIAYSILERSLEDLALDEVAFCPQTMAPFPWHFGGQRHQNLFVFPEEIARWCMRLKLGLCFDLSHSALTCNHFGLDLQNYLVTVTPFIKHIHMGDASGVNGEGLQIGQGEINMDMVCDRLAELSDNVSFIPEIWQGHKDGGREFWKALRLLEGKL